jgi:hypothetical protein
MDEEFVVEGRVGDVSGRVGDVSGRVGDVSGRVGDVSGDATFDEVRELLVQDRRAINFGCLERRLANLEFEIVALARWFELRLRDAERKLDTRIDQHTADINKLKKADDAHNTTLVKHDERLKKLECPPKP